MTPLERLQELMALTFGMDPDEIRDDTQREQIPEWDSVGHLNLMLALEDAFGLSLQIDDMARLTSVPQILRYLETACPSP
jgi:citrate synthase